MQDELLVRLVSAYGPRNRTKIARRLGVSRETVARRYERLRDEGLGPRPNIRMEKLGLQRFAALARKGEKIGRNQLPSLFDLMGDYAYLEHYQKLDPSDAYLLMFSMPSEMLPELRDFLDSLEDSAILVGCKPFPLSWMRYHSIRAPWKDAASLVQATSGPLTYVPEGEPHIARRRLDHCEVLLLSALQANPDANLAGLLDTLREWGAQGHDAVRACVSNASTDWNLKFRGALRFVGSFPMHLSRGDPSVARRKRHSWASFTLWWEGLGRDEVRRSAMASTSVPYLRTDGASFESGFYFSIFSAPSKLIPGYIDFMSQNAPGPMSVALASSFANYSLPFLSFSPEEGFWEWKKERLQSRLVALQTP